MLYDQAITLCKGELVRFREASKVGKVLAIEIDEADLSVKVTVETGNTNSGFVKVDCIYIEREEGETSTFLQDVNIAIDILERIRFEIGPEILRKDISRAIQLIKGATQGEKLIVE